MKQHRQEENHAAPHFISEEQMNQFKTALEENDTSHQTFSIYWKATPHDLVNEENHKWSQEHFKYLQFSLEKQDMNCW